MNGYRLSDEERRRVAAAQAPRPPRTLAQRRRNPIKALAMQHDEGNKLREGKIAAWIVFAGFAIPAVLQYLGLWVV